MRQPQRTPTGGVAWWTLEQAAALSTSQLSPSGCGPTAAVDVLQLLGLPCDPTQVQASAPARLRDYDAPLLQYLLSRARAGTTHLDLLQAVEQLSRGEVRGTFFSIHPLTPGPTLGQWLYRWIEAGAVPVLTMNLFLHANDAWHHQVVCGVEPPRTPSAVQAHGSLAALLQHENPPSSWQVLLLNPLDHVSAVSLVQVLSTPPFMIIPRDHVERKLLETQLDNKSGSPAAGSNTRQHTAAHAGTRALLDLCGYLQVTPPWSDSAVSEQLLRVFLGLVGSRSPPDSPKASSPPTPSTSASPGGQAPCAQEPSNSATCTRHQHMASVVVSGGHAVKSNHSVPTGQGRDRGAGVASSAAAGSRPSHTRFGDLVIPWGGLAGVTLFAREGSTAQRWLQAKDAWPDPNPEAKNPNQPPGPMPGGTSGTPTDPSCFSQGGTCSGSRLMGASAISQQVDLSTSANVAVAAGGMFKEGPVSHAPQLPLQDDLPRPASSLKVGMDSTAAEPVVETATPAAESAASLEAGVATSAGRGAAQGAGDVSAAAGSVGTLFGLPTAMHVPLPLYPGAVARVHLDMSPPLMG